MELQEYVRKPFPVTAVQVDFQNAYEVAEWCKGEVVLQATQLLGGAGKGKMDLPTVVFKGTGDYRDKEFVAKLGDWVVELRGNFRVFKKAQFKATFDPAPKKQEAHETDEKIIAATQTLLDVGMLKLQDNPPSEIVHDSENKTCSCDETHNCGPDEVHNPPAADEDEEAAIAEQEREDALHNAGQL